MKINRRRIAAAALVFILPFLFFVPVVHYAIPSGSYACPANGCNFLLYGSATYWSLGVGGTWREVTGYAISVAPAPTSVVIGTSSVSYTVTAGPAHTTTSVTDNKNDLQLQLSLNASSSSANGVIVSVFADEYNTLASTNNVTVGQSWPVTIGDLDGAPCWSGDWPLGFAIASGQYTSANITAAKFLDLVDPGASYSCPLFVGYGDPTGFSFQPMSDVAATYGCIGPCLTGSVATGVEPPSWTTVTGYWNQAGVFTSFPRGTYTVVADDEWGELAIAYFTVA